MKHRRIKQRSPEWYQARLEIPTASCFSQILTPKTRKASAQAQRYMEIKLGEWISGEPYELYQSPYMERGQELEDDAIRAYEYENDVETDEGGFWLNDAETAGASPDRLVGADGLLEIKCPLLHTQIHRALYGEEDDHMIQLQGQLWITERQWVDVYHFHPQLMLPALRFYRDEELIKLLAIQVDLFVEQMLKKREELERKYGPFERRGTPAPPLVIDNRDGVTEEDVAAIFVAARLRREEASNG